MTGIPSAPAAPADAPARALDAGVETAAEAFQRRRRQRIVPVLLVLLTGLVSTVAALAPGAAGLAEASLDPGPLLPDVAGRLAHLEAGVVLLLAAPALARGSRLAWSVSVAACSGSLVVDALQQQATAGGVLAALALLALVPGAAAFRSRVSLRARLLRFPAGLLAAFLLFAVIAAVEVPAVPGQSVLERLEVLAAAAVLPAVGTEHGPAGAWGNAARLAALLGVAAVVAAVRPCVHAWRRERVADPRGHAETHGRSSNAPLIALPDSALVGLLQGEALAGVAVRGGVAVALGTPVAPLGREIDALVELTAACEARGLVPVLLGLDERQRRLAEETGYAAKRLGVEAFLDPATFSTAGKRRANVRHSVTRAERDGVEVLRYDESVRTPARDAQLAAISAAWVESKGGPELGFTLGRFDLDRLDEQEVVVAVVGRDTDAERVVAFVTWLPYDGGRQAVLDLMRRAADCPPGVMEKLVVDSVADAARRGRVRLSLGGVPLASTTPREGRVERALGWLYENGRSVYDAHGLFRFKDKFAPDWEPLYVAAPAEAHLPRVAVAVGRAFLPAGAARTVLRGLVAREWGSVRARVAEAQAGRAGGGAVSAPAAEDSEVTAVEARADGSRGVSRPRLPWVPALVCGALLTVSALTRAPLGALPDEVAASAAWSTEQVLAGEVWRAATASLLTRDAPMLVAMLASVWLVIGMVQRLLGAAAALATWVLGCLVGYLGTAAVVGLLAGHWELAAAASRTVDYGPSGGVAAGLAVVTVVLRHRAVTLLVVGGGAVGSALHHQIADVEHVVAFVPAWVATRLLLAAAARRRAARDTAATEGHQLRR